MADSLGDALRVAMAQEQAARLNTPAPGGYPPPPGYADGQNIPVPGGSLGVQAGVQGAPRELDWGALLNLRRPLQ